MCLAWPGASHTNRGNGRLVGCVFCGAPVLGIALALAAPNPTSLLESFPASVARLMPGRYRGIHRATGIPPAVSRVSASHSLCCAPAARPVGRALEAGSRGNHPAASRRVLMLVRTPRGVRFLVFRPEKPSAIVRALRCAQVLLTLAGSPDSSRKLFPRAPAWRPALISWENFVSFLRFQDLHCASLTNRHFVPSRAKNEEESKGGRRSPIHYQSKEDTTP